MPSDSDHLVICDVWLGRWTYGLWSLSFEELRSKILLEHLNLVRDLSVRSSKLLVPRVLANLDIVPSVTLLTHHVHDLRILIKMAIVAGGAGSIKVLVERETLLFAGGLKERQVVLIITNNGLEV